MSHLPFVNSLFRLNLTLEFLVKFLLYTFPLQSGENFDRKANFGLILASLQTLKKYKKDLNYIERNNFGKTERLMYARPREKYVMFGSLTYPIEIVIKNSTV